MQQLRVILKVSLVLLLCLISLSIPIDGFAAASKEAVSSHWGFSKEIRLESKAAYQHFYLDNEVYGQAAVDLRDLRIMNGSGEFIPFYIDSEAEAIEESVVSYTSSLMGTARKGRDTLFDYKIIPIRENTDIQGNTLVFDLPEEAFLKHVQVFGSYDGNTWELLKKSDLYSTDGLNQNRIELEATYKFSHFRLLVKDNIENLNFGKLQLLHNNRELRMRSYLRLQTPNYEMKQEGNRTEIHIQNKDHLKVSKITLQSSGNFTRSYELLDDSGKVIGTKGSTELYRMDFKDARIEATEIVPSTVVTSSFKIIIYNHDDAPIKISGISAEYVVDKLVFAESGAGPYQLLYGNVEASTPQYDISNFKDLIEAGDVGLATLGAENPVLKEITSAKSNRFFSKMGFNAVIIVVSLLLIIILARKMKAH